MSLQGWGKQWGKQKACGGVSCQEKSAEKASFSIDHSNINCGLEHLLWLGGGEGNSLEFSIKKKKLAAFSDQDLSFIYVITVNFFAVVV